MDSPLSWDIYTITSDVESLNGVMLRGRLRKFATQHGITLLCENTTDIENGVRFALLAGTDCSAIKEYLATILPHAACELTLTSIENPVLSKLKVNKSDRYTL